MLPEIPTGLRQFEKWLADSAAEAAAVVPELLALPAPLLLRELRLRPELRTPGVLRRLLVVSRECISRFPSRAHEITVAVTRYARLATVPREFAFVTRTLQGEAWRDHASALREIGRSVKAEHATELARRFFEDTPGSDWYLATVDLIEAPLLHDRGLRDEALAMVRRAAYRFGLSRDHARFLEARMMESWMLWAAGDRAAASQLWTVTTDAARGRGDVALMARLAAKMGVFELRYGSADEASRLLAAALKLFDDSGHSGTDDAVRARWSFAEAVAAQGRAHEAISEYHIVRAQFLERGALTDAAIAGVEALDLYLQHRPNQLSAVAATLVQSFRDAGMPINAMEALAYLRSRSDAGTLTHDDAILARSFFEDLLHKPNARFRTP